MSLYKVFTRGILARSQYKISIRGLLARLLKRSLYLHRRSSWGISKQDVCSSFLQKISEQVAARFVRACAVEMHTDMSVTWAILCANLQEKCHAPGPRHSRNAHGHITRAILCGNVQQKCRPLNRLKRNRKCKCALILWFCANSYTHCFCFGFYALCLAWLGLRLCMFMFDVSVFFVVFVFEFRLLPF